MHRKPARRTATIQRAWSLAIVFAIALVAALHATILIQRVDDHSIARPEVVARWVAGAAVALAGLALRRATRTPRRAWLIFWLIVALLHLLMPASALLAVAPLLLLGGRRMAATSGVALRLVHDEPERAGASIVSTAQDRAPPRAA